MADKRKAGVPLGKGRIGGLDGWAEDVATRAGWRKQEDRQRKGGKR